MSKIRPIDAIAFERKIRQHAVWNTEGVIELIRTMPTIGVVYEKKKKENCDKCVLNTDHGKICSAYNCEFKERK